MKTLAPTTRTHRAALVAAALLAACLCVVFACAQPTSAKADASYDRTGARSMLSNVNNLRANEAWITLADNTRYNLPKLDNYAWDSGLEKVAMLRAKEIASSFSHTRPNGQSFDTAYSELGVSTPAKGENIAMGYGSVESVMAGWAEANESYSGQGHRRNMLGGVYQTGSKSVSSVGFTCIGIAHYVQNGIHYWVQEFGSEKSSGTWKRLAGNTAIGTMKAIVSEGWEESEWAIVATTNGYYDALSASGLAGLLDCPILMTAPDELSNATKALIQSKKVKHVVVVGGTSAVSNAVKVQIEMLGVSVKRVAGNTAIGTANAIYEYGKTVNGGWGGDAIVATSGGYQDALSIAPYAYKNKAPIFLARGSAKTPATLTDSTLAKLWAGGFTRTIITGGEAAVAKSVESQVPNYTRLGGNTAYGTSKKVANFCLAAGMTVSHMGVATGKSYYDALAGAALCGKMNSIIILADDGNSNNVGNVIDSRRASLQQSCYVFGGTSAIQPTVWNKVVG